MNTLQMNDKEKELFSSIHTSILPNRKKDFDKKGISSTNPNPETEQIIIKTKEVLDMFEKKDYNLSKYRIEFHKRNCGFEKKSKLVFGWHKDDYSTINFKVYTVIYYLRKDETIKGGDLEYMVKDENYKQKIESGQILCFDGDLLHRPELCSGIGCRDTIVVFVKRKTNAIDRVKAWSRL